MRLREGFTLIEALATTIILAFSVGTIIQMQLGSFNRVRSDHERLERIFILKNKLMEMVLHPSYDKKNISQTSRVESPNVRVLQEVQDISPRSSLHQFSGRVYALSVKGSWVSRTTTRADAQEMTLLSFALAKPVEQKS